MYKTSDNSIVIADDLLIDTNHTITSSEKTSRISAMDIQRGLIMTLMAFSHCQEYVGVKHYNNLEWNISPAWKGTSIFNILQQAFISTVAAGGFFMMMGIGIVFLYHSRLKDGWPQINVCKYLFKRGTLLVLLQLTLLQAFECIAERKLYLYVGVLFALGVCMIFAAITLYLSYKLKSLRLSKTFPVQYFIPITTIILISLSMQLYITHLHHSGNAASLWETVFFLSGHFNWGIDIDINFTPIPWFPAVAFGLIIGQIIHENKTKSFQLIGIIGITLILSWLFIRSGNLTGLFSVGDYKFLNENERISFPSYFSVSKYPPSMTYFMWSLGLNLLCIFGIHQAEKYHLKLINLLSPLKVFGQCALFFFICHWFVYYGWSLLLGAKLTSIPGNVLIWLLGLFILYPLCITYRTFKFTKSKDSIWRMF